MNTPEDANTETPPGLARLILASASPQRRLLLAQLGIPFAIAPAHIDEPDWDGGEEPEAYVQGLAMHKALAAAERLRGFAQMHPWTPYACQYILGADTVVFVHGRSVGKPHTPEEATAILRFVRGTEHRVMTAVVLARLDRDGRIATQQGVDTTRIDFAPLTDDDIAWYVGTGEPLGKAGACALQGLGRRFILEVRGREDTVIGLPLNLVRAFLPTAFRCAPAREGQA